MIGFSLATDCPRLRVFVVTFAFHGSYVTACNQNSQRGRLAVFVLCVRHRMPMDSGKGSFGRTENASRSRKHVIRSIPRGLLLCMAGYKCSFRAALRMGGM